MHQIGPLLYMLAIVLIYAYLYLPKVYPICVDIQWYNTYNYLPSILKKGAIMAKAVKSETLSFKISPELKEKLEALAAKENRSLSNFVQTVLAREVGKPKSR